MLEYNLQNELFNRTYSKITGSEPATSQPVINHYVDTTFEWERARHVFFLGVDDPHMNHGLYNDENANVEYIPAALKGGHH